MTTWIQFKDGVSFASVESPYYIKNSIPLEDGVRFEDVHPKKYKNDQWVDAPLIYFVTHLQDNVVLGMNSTVYSSDVTGDIVDSSVQIGWIKGSDGTYAPPVVVKPPNYAVWIKEHLVVGITEFPDGVDDIAAIEIARAEGYDKYVWLNERAIPKVGSSYSSVTDSFTEPV